MYEIGDHIVYGNNGVCIVEDIGKIDSAVMAKDRIYYTLRPCYTKGSTIFTPVDNQKVLIRSVLSKEDALQLIDEMKDIECLWIADEKKRENEYKAALGKCDCRELVKIIKAIYERQQSRMEEGKKITAGDIKYFQMAEESLYGELAISLDMNKEKVRAFVVGKVKEMEELEIQ